MRKFIGLVVAGVVGFLIGKRKEQPDGKRIGVLGLLILIALVIYMKWVG